MLKYIIVLLFVSISFVLADFDPLCNADDIGILTIISWIHHKCFNSFFFLIYTDAQADPNPIPIPTIGLQDRMQATVERIKSDFPLTEEIIEWYDGALNIGVARSTVGGVTVETYSYYAVNELLLVKGK